MRTQINNLFGEIFEFILTNKMHFTYMYSQFDEAYLYEIVRFDFAFNHIPSGPLKFDMFVEFGMGYAYNARLVDSNTYLKYEYDDKHGQRHTHVGGYLVESQKTIQVVDV